jgi:hypothetical protein
MNLRDPYGEKCREMDRQMAVERDAERYRWLRDRAGNKIMRRLMKESIAPEWDRIVDEDRRTVGKPGGAP